MITPWRVAESTITYADRWLRVRSDRCVTGAGHVIAPYHVLEYPPWVSVLALTPAHEAVLIHQYRHGVGRVVLELPAGSMDAGEDPAQAAARELMEETGYRAEEVAVLGSAYANPASQTNVSWCCLALGARPAGPATPELGEDIEVERRDVLRVFRDVEEGAMSLQATHVTTVHLAAAFLRRTERADLSGLRARLRAYLVDQE